MAIPGQYYNPVWISNGKIVVGEWCCSNFNLINPPVVITNSLINKGNIDRFPFIGCEIQLFEGETGNGYVRLIEFHKIGTSGLAAPGGYTNS